MTLERHRSYLIPDVECTPEGIFVTDRDGSFALRGKQRSGRATPPADYDTMRSYGSSSHRPRAYKPRPLNQFAQESNNNNYGNTMTSSAVSTMSSLGRRLRRTKSARLVDEKRFGSVGRSTVSSSGGTRRLRGGTPQMSAEMSASLSRQKKARSLDLSLKRKSNSGGPVLSNGKSHFPLSADLTSDVVPLAKRMTEQRLPGKFFIVDGLLLLLLGFIRLFVSFWHEYYCALWSGGLIFLLGILGMTHRGDYLTKWKNGSYIAIGLLAAVAVMAATVLSLEVLVPLIKNVVSESDAADAAYLIDFTNMNKTTIGTSVSAATTVYSTLVFDLCIIIMLLFNFFTLTASMMAVCNHWDAVYTSTGQCDFRGTPRFFNPLEQISLGQATLFLGILCIALLTADVNIYYSPGWAPMVVIASGMCSMVHLRRVDLKWLGYLSILIEVCGLVACAASLTFVALAMAKDVEKVYKNEGISQRERGERIASACGEGSYLLTMVANLVYTAGVLFRQARLVLCRCCRDDVNI